MNEIKQVKTFWKRSSGEIITFTEGTLMDIIQRGRSDINFLITTIESQKGQLETCKEAIEALVEDHRFQKAKSDDRIQKIETEAKGYMKRIESQKEEIERLKSAITMIGIHNGSIDSYSEIEAIISELQEGEKS